MSRATPEEVLSACNEQIDSLQDLMYRESSRTKADFERQDPKLLRDYKSAITSRYNFTAEVIDLIKETQHDYPNNKDLDIMYNRYSDCLRQMRALIDRL